MKTNFNSETTAPAKPWWIVRPTLVVTLATLLGVLGVVVACPAMVDQTIAVVL